MDFTEDDIAKAVTAGYPELMKKLVRHQMDEGIKQLQGKRGRGKKRSEPPRVH